MCSSTNVFVHLVVTHLLGPIGSYCWVTSSCNHVQELSLLTISQLTFSLNPQLLTDHCSIIPVPAVITGRAQDSIIADLHSPLSIALTTNQMNSTICAASINGWKLELNLCQFSVISSGEFTNNSANLYLFNSAGNIKLQIHCCLYVTSFPLSSFRLFAVCKNRRGRPGRYCKWSKSGQWEGRRMRLVYTYTFFSAKTLTWTINVIIPHSNISAVFWIGVSQTTWCIQRCFSAVTVYVIKQDGSSPTSKPCTTDGWPEHNNLCKVKKKYSNFTKVLVFIFSALSTRIAMLIRTLLNLQYLCE